MILKRISLKEKNHFTENFEGNINPTEVVANLICEKDDFVAGIENVFENVKGSCSMLILTENGIIAARDKLGRTPVVIGKKEGAYAVAVRIMCLSQHRIMKSNIIWAREKLSILHLMVTNS